MKIITVKTGFGYFQNDKGDIICKSRLPIGEHPCKDNYTYIEIADENALNMIDIFDPPETDDQKTEKKINLMQRKLAIIELKSQGLLPTIYPEPEII